MKQKRRELLRPIGLLHPWRQGGMNARTLMSSHPRPLSGTTGKSFIFNEKTDLWATGQFATVFVPAGKAFRCSCLPAIGVSR
jgi:hypothetical protein